MGNLVQLLGPGAVYYQFLFNDLPVLLEDVPLHQQHMYACMMGHTSFSLHHQAANEPDFWWTVDRT